MRRLALATIICCAAWPCAASFTDLTPPQWAWPPTGTTPGVSSAPALSLPQVLVSAAQYGGHLTDGLPRDPVSAQGLVQAADTQQAVAAGNIPLPRPRLAVEKADVPIEDVCNSLTAAAQAQKLPVAFFIRLIWQESHFDARAVSPVGAQGVAQFMPTTAAAMGLKNPFDPLEALHFSARLLRDLVGQFGNLGLAAAAYNAGPKRILDWMAKRSKLPDETRNYVQSITGHAAERWRFTRPGRLSVDVPKRAPCQGVMDVAYLVEVPAPPPPPPKRKARSRLLAKAKAGDHKPAAVARRNAPMQVSAARSRNKTRSASKPMMLIARASAARTPAKQHRTRVAASR